jgi:hypothetical protein
MKSATHMSNTKSLLEITLMMRLHRLRATQNEMYRIENKK